MLSVSDKWKQAIREQFRYQGYLQVYLQVTPPGLQESIKIDTADTEVVSATDAMVDKKSIIPTPYATLEYKRWRLNGTYKILSKQTVTNDWWSTPLANGSKELVFTFDQEYDIPGVYVEWDLVNHSYPSSLTIKGYSLSKQEIYSYTITSIHEESDFIEAPMDNVASVSLTINSWSRDGWRARISEILFGLYTRYDSSNNGRIVSGTSIDSSYPLSDELPTHTFSIELRNLDKEFDPSLSSGIARYLAQRQLAKYRWGFATANGEIEWTQQLTYYIDSFKVPADSKNVTLDATSRLAFLTEQFNAVEYDAENKTLYDVATEVLEQSDVIKTTPNEKPWVLSNTLKLLKTNAPIPNEPINTILQYIANASNLQLFVRPTDGFICIDSTDDDVVQQVLKGQELGDPEIQIQEQLYTISVGVTSYFKDVNAGEITVGNGEYNLNGRNTLTIQYTCDYAVDVKCKITGATLVAFTPYASFATVIIDAPGNSTDVVITLTGYEVKKSTTVIETYRNSSISSGLKVVIDNPFITNTSYLKSITTNVLNWYSKTQQQKISYLGYPELTAGDTIHLATDYTDQDVKVIKTTLDFDGGFNGTIEVR